jgi:pimeloyl-ACP methyl ester carboxylesterase
MRLPALLQRAAPWVRLDASRTFAVGVSMGAQEVLCLAARYPDRLAGVAAFDGVTDLSARYGEVLLSARGGPGVLKRMRHEMGGTPQQAPFAYRQRSPRSYAATLASAGVPVQLWWSPRDIRVINQSTTQTGDLYRRICRLGPAPHVTEIRTDLAHGVAFSAAKGFRQMLAGFRPNGDWATTKAVAPEGWTYIGSLRAASFWGYGVRLARPPHALWRMRLDGSTALIQSREALQLTVPWAGTAREVLVTVNGKPQTAVAAGGSFTVRIPAGTSVVLMAPAGERTR